MTGAPPRLPRRHHPDVVGRAATDLAGYNVYRASSAGGTYTKLNTALLTGTSFNDTAAPEGVASYYQVTAVNAAGRVGAVGHGQCHPAGHARRRRR